MTKLQKILDSIKWFTCIHKSDYYTCGASICKFKQKQPCLACGYTKYKDTFPEWYVKCRIELLKLGPCTLYEPITVGEQK